MLSKIWKKLLLAICIIAILFNITSKLVNRISLEKTIESSPDGIDVRELLDIEEEPITEKDRTSHYNTVTEESIKEQPAQEATEEVNQEETENGTVEGEETQKTLNTSEIFNVTDISEFTTLLY